MLYPQILNSNDNSGGTLAVDESQNNSDHPRSTSNPCPNTKSQLRADRRSLRRTNKMIWKENMMKMLPVPRSLPRQKPAINKMLTMTML
jgi:hypothetical protein